MIRSTTGRRFQTDSKASKDPGPKILIIGTGEFGNALAQSTQFASIADKKNAASSPPANITNATVVHVSAKDLFLNQTEDDMVDLLNQTEDEMVDLFTNCCCIMYCGKRLTQHSQTITSAMIKARSLSTSAPLVNFIDWSNPDPGVDDNEDLKGAVTLACCLEEAYADYSHLTKSQHWKVWKATGVSNLDVAGHMGQVTVTIYGGSLCSSLSGSEIPGIQIPGIVWKLPQQSSLLDEVYDRLITRSEVDRWYDASLLSLAIFLFTFGYAFTRYSEYVNGNYPNTMVPMYLMNKAVAWTSLWMIIVCPFAGNILTMGAVIKDKWAATTIMDKFLVLVFAVLTVVPVFLFFIPWGLWCVLRHLFFMGHQYNSKSIYKRQDDNYGNSIIRASLIDMVSLKHEAGVIGFLWTLAHSMLGSIVADAAYKTKWFQENGRLYGNNEISLVLGVVGFTLITAVTVRSLFGSDSWMKLKPMYTIISPLGILMATLHVVFMGYKGWNKLFDYSTKKGQPSITFMSTMLPLVVLLVNFGLDTFGTKKRAGRQKIWKHSATNAAHLKFEEMKNGIGTTMCAETWDEKIATNAAHLKFGEMKDEIGSNISTETWDEEQIEC